MYRTVWYGLVPEAQITTMPSDNYNETRPRILVKEDSKRELRSFAERYDIPFDRVYGFAFENLAREIQNNEKDEIAEAIKNE